jgi:hypothetical protein
MDTATISPHLQVVIPRQVQKYMNSKPGEKSQVKGCKG